MLDTVCGLVLLKLAKVVHMMIAIAFPEVSYDLPCQTQAKRSVQKVGLELCT